ncbi:T9SS type A sorting domain-containing protein [candidate division KSB1 bacterium]|nr:T9SS type A sorting domain-containing protein [candidate division KSB1 bacterium]
MAQQTLRPYGVFTSKRVMSLKKLGMLWLRPILAICAFVLLQMEPLIAGSPHTITVDGSNDFAGDEDVPGTSGSTWYFTWDAANFYFGVNAPDVAANSATKFVLLYIDSDPRQNPLSGNGTSTGQNYNTQTPGLPFNADYHFRWRADNTFTDLMSWDGSSWVGGNNSGVTAFQSGTFVEYQIPRANLGSPSQAYVCGAMINEQGGVESTFFIAPQANGPDGYDKDFAHYFGFALVEGISPDFSGNENTYPVASATTGNFSNGATWTGGVTPHNNSNVFILNGHTVTLDANNSAKHLTTVSGGTFDGNNNTLNLANDAILTNFGAFNASAGEVAFAGTGTINGTIAFDDVSIAAGVDFGISATVNGILQINTGGFVNTNAPTYGSSSTLNYNTGGSYNVFTEWIGNAGSGAGVPQNVLLSNGTTLNLFASNRTANGDLTIESSSTLNSTSGTLSVGGNFTNDGNFSSAGGTVFFFGSGTKTVGGGATIDFNNIAVNMGTSASILDVQSPMTMATNGLALTQGTFKLSSASTITPFSGAETIPANAGFHLNHSGAVSHWGSPGSMTLIGALTIDNGVVHIGSGANDQLTLTSATSKATINGGVLNLAGRVRVENSGAGNGLIITGGEVVVTKVGNSGTHSFYILSTGNFIMSSGAVTIERATSGTWDVNILSGASKSITGGEFRFGNALTPAGPGMGVQNLIAFHNLTIDNPAGVTLQSNATVNNTLTFLSGNIITGNTLIVNISTGGTVARTSGHVDGNLRKHFTTGSNVARTFEVGTGADYAPVDITVANVFGAGTLTLRSFAGDHPSIGSSNLNPAKSVNRRWSVSGAGLSISTYSATLNFVSSDLDAGVNTNILNVGRFSAAAWTYPAVVARTASSTQATGIGGFGFLQVAEPLTPPGVTIAESDGSTDVTEDGATDTYTVVLNTIPASDVTIAFSTGSQFLSINPVTFTPGIALIPQIITVMAADDAIVEGSHTGTITHSTTSSDASYNGISIANVTVNIADNDAAGVTLMETSGSTDVTESGTTDTYTVVLNTVPASDVTITFNTGSQIQPISSLLFTPGDALTPQTVTVVAVDDAVAEGNHTGAITHTVISGDANYNSIAIVTVTANITDNDIAGVAVVESGGSTDVSEDGTTDTYAVVLTTVPASGVSVTVDPDNQLDVGAGPGNSITLTFLPGDATTPQTVTVTATDDAAVEGVHTGAITHAATSSDANYNGVTIVDVAANITDNDVAGQEMVFLANSSVLIAGNRVSDGDIYSNDKIEFDNTSPLGQHTGNLTAVGMIRIKSKNKIIGNVTAGNNVHLSSNAIVTGTVSEFAGVAIVPLPTLSFSAGGSDVIVPKHDSQSLLPGSYDYVKLEDKATLYLSAGDYYINVLDTDPFAKLSLDVSGGEVNVNVIHGLSFARKVQVVVAGGTTDQVTFSVRSTQAVVIERHAIIRGNIIAPDALVHFVRDSKFKGHVSAENIFIGEKVDFQHHSSVMPFPKENETEEEELAEVQSLVTSYALEQNYPNPFNPSTTISFALPETGEVSLEIYNLKGQLVKKLVAGEMEVGRHSLMWDATDEHGQRVASGVYVYVIRAGEFTARRKLVLMK